MKLSSNSRSATSVAARIAGEDLKLGDYITVLNEIVELPSFLWCCAPVSLPPDEPVRFRYTPRGAGTPLKVVGICLPFVYALNSHSSVVTFDTRNQQLVRLDRKCARRIWRKLNRKSPIHP
jgi:hypothetical protein